jgi:hypothetical protein
MCGRYKRTSDKQRIGPSHHEDYLRCQSQMGDDERSENPTFRELGSSAETSGWIGKRKARFTGLIIKDRLRLSSMSGLVCSRFPTAQLVRLDARLARMEPIR